MAVLTAPKPCKRRVDVATCIAYQGSSSPNLEAGTATGNVFRRPQEVYLVLSDHEGLFRTAIRTRQYP